MKTALITGITGQDGAYLARLLLDKGYRVVGGFRRSSSLDDWRLRALGIEAGEIEFAPLELLEAANVRRLIARIEPDEVYNLAAQTFVGASFEQPEYVMQANAIGPLHLLEAIRETGKRSKFYQASTSEMFGNSPAPQSEATPFEPRSPYGIAKLAAHWLTVNYRESYGMRACCGILFNHESPLRGPEFVTQKIAKGLARIKLGSKTPLELGNLEAKRDWGFAGDYVEGMWLMMQQAEPWRDFVLATGHVCAVRGFCGLIADVLELELEWQGEGLDAIGTHKGQAIVKVNRALFRPAEVNVLCGDCRLATEELGWAPSTNLQALARMMAEAAYAEGVK